MCSGCSICKRLHTGIRSRVYSRLDGFFGLWLSQRARVTSCWPFFADHKVIVWKLNDSPDDTGNVGYARRALTGHSQCVQDVVINSDAQFALSGSWDKTLRLWDLNVGVTVRSFKGHASDVNSVAFSPDNRQIVSGSRDRTIKLWNTLAECKYTIVDDQHYDWVSCVRFSPSASKPLIVSCGWDKLVKVR